MEQYIVSARKYRPGKFSDVVGQEQVSRTLKNALSSGHLAQSFLFCGPRGVGKTTCARILAKAINCETPAADMEPCNECNSCQSFNQNASFNIFELDAASNNSVDDIRSLIEQVRYIPQSGKYKVYIIDEVHMLSAAAFNAFLKTLEEPPSYVIFILATTEKHKIIPTILSRCQIYDFRRIEVKEIVYQLKSISEKEGIKAEEAALHLIAQKSDGSLRDALSLFDKQVSLSGVYLQYATVAENLSILDYEYYFRITGQILTEDSSAVLLTFDEVLRKGFDGEIFMIGLAEHLRNLLVSKDPVTANLLETSDDIRYRYAEQAAMTPEAFLLNALNLCNQCDINYKTAKNKRLLVELTLLKMTFLISRLEQGEAAGEKKAVKPGLKKSDISPAKFPEQELLHEPEKKVAIVSEPDPEKFSVKKEEIIPEAETKKEELLQPEPEKAAQGSRLAGLKEKWQVGGVVHEVIKDSGQPVAANEFLLLDENCLHGIWDKICEHLKPYVSSTFLEVAKKAVVSWKEPSAIILELDNKMAETIITQQRMKIASAIYHLCGRTDIELNIVYNRKNGEETETKKYMTPKEIFRAMSAENPALLELKQRLDLDIE